MEKPPSSPSLTAHRLSVALVLVIASLLSTAGPSRAGGVDEITAAPSTPAVTYTFASPLLVDSSAGRLFGTVAANGQDEHIGVYSTRDGRPLARYPYKGPFALDTKGSRLFVISGPNQVTVLDAQSGKALRTLTIPGGSSPTRPTAAPQYDPQNGVLLVFTGNMMTRIDPNTGKEAGSTRFDVEVQDRCRTQAPDPLPINRSYFDPERGLVYLEFTTYSCIPWIGYSIVSYDLNKGTEISRQATDRYTGLSAAGGFYAEGWMRFGIGTIWSERDGKPATRSTGWSTGSGFQLDPKRGRLYQSAEGSIRIFDPATMLLKSVAPQPVKGTLAAYDPASDQLYFVDGQTVRVSPAAKLGAGASTTPKLQKAPREAVRLVVPSPSWQRDKTIFAVWSPAWPETACYVFGQTGGSMLVSRDGGSQWLRGQTGLPACAQVTALAVSSAYPNDRTVLAGIKGNGIFKSTDGGAAWHPFGAGLPHVGVSGLVLSPGFAADRTAFATVGDNGLQRSTDGGSSWQTLPTAINPVVGLSPEFDRDGAVAVLGMKPDGMPLLQLSEDRGDHWRTVPATLPATTPRLLSLAPAFARWHVMFIGDFNGDLYRSADGGISWQRVLQTGKAQVPGTGADRVQIVYGPNEERREVFLVVSGIRYEGEQRVAWGNLYRSADGGQTWTEMDAGKGNVPTALAISPSYLQDGILFVGTAAGQVIRDIPGRP